MKVNKNKAPIIEQKEVKKYSYGGASFMKFAPAVTNYPIEKVNSSKGIVSWGDRNDYPYYLVSLFKENSVHKGIIEQKVKFISSASLSVIEGDESILDNFDGEFTLNDIQKLCSLDIELFNGFAILFRKNINGKYVAEPLDFETVRATENPFVFKVSDNWLDNRCEVKSYLSISYNEDEEIYNSKGELIVTDLEEVEEDCFILHYKEWSKQGLVNGKINSNYYPTPSYSGAIQSIVALSNMNKFTANETKNGFKGGTHVGLNNGLPEDKDESRRIKNEIASEVSNMDEAGGVFITFSDGGDSKPDVGSFNGNDLDKRYDQAKKTCREDIMIAHQVISPALFGITGESLFGSKEEMEVAYTLFQKNYVSMKQDVISEALTWAETELNDFQGEIIFNSYKLSLESNIEEVEEVDNSMKKTIEAINAMSPLVANKVLESLTKNEIRSLAGLDAIEGGDVVESIVSVEESFASKYKMTTEEIDEALVLKCFEECGRPKDSVKFVSKFDIALTENQQIVLNLIKEKNSFDAIVQATELSVKEVAGIITYLQSINLLDGFNLTEKGNDLTVSEEEIEVVFSYEVRSDVPPAKSGSRNFCKALMALNKVYTREEIDTISSRIGRDAWLYRGGWYHNPDTDRNTPSCRHEWRQQTIINLR